MMISYEDLHEWFNYDPVTGEFSWRKQALNGSWEVGDMAGSIRSHPKSRRRVLRLRGQRIYASRAAYIMTHGSIPKNALLDHIDGDTLNDRIANLRLANSVQNAWNRIQKNDAPLKKGVSKNPRGQFQSRIVEPRSGVKLNLGTWPTEKEAHAAYMGAAAVLHGAYWVGERLGYVSVPITVPVPDHQGDAPDV